ncbi:TonB-dependent receptor [Alteromonadaceae bacterium Bs31]|nr:TonB-dependent receptor [Alteromonadaceae bacterium Bs31]
MNTFKMKPLVAAISLTLAASAVAQEAENVEEVYVTGFRGSLQNSLDAKRAATGVVDAIYAEDIADFPDNNLAESLQRIPGVAITRSGGEGRNISVRGLGPSFTRVRINGMESMSSTGGTDATGGNNRGRGFDFNTFSSELFNNLVVQKTNNAQTEEGSLGATVDLRTARPMDYDDFTLAVSGQAGYNDKSEETSPKVSFLVSNQFTDTFGALLSVSYSDRTVVDEGSSTVRWSNAESFGSVGGVDCVANPTDAGCTEVNGGAFHPRIPRYDSYTHEIQRTGAALTLQWQPGDATDVVLDVLYAQHEATRAEIFMQGVMNSGSAFAGYDLTNYTIEGSTLVNANVDGANLKSENRFDEMSTDFTQVTLNFSHDFSDQLTMNAMLGTSSSEFSNPVQSTIIMQATDASMSWDYSGSSSDAGLTFGPEAYVAANWDANSMRQRPQGTNNDFTTAMAELAYDFNDSLTLKGGVNVKSFEFDTYQSRYASEGAGGIDMQTEGYITTFDSGLGAGPAWLIPNRSAIVANEGLLSNQGDWEVFPRERDTYSVTEDTTSAFLQLDFSSELAGRPISGDIGFRYFSTDQSTTGWFDEDGDGTNTQVWVDHTYDDILPSANLRFEAMDDVVIRLGMSEGIARAGLSSLKADQSISVSGTSRSISGGNPLLEPTKALSYDAAVELYFSDDAAMTLAIFRKDIESHVQSLKDQQKPTDLGIPTAIIEDECNGGPDGYGADCNENLLWDRSVPLNGPGGDLHGFEWQYQTTFGFMGDVGEYFGFIGNYTYVKSQLAYLDRDGNVDVVADLLNLSEVTQSATVYFENDNWSARFALVERSDYLTDARGRNGNVQHGTYGTSNLDFSAAYTLSDNWKFTFEALNLTGEADDQWVDVNDKRLSYYHETGTQFYVGAQYKF